MAKFTKTQVTDILSAVLSEVPDFTGCEGNPYTGEDAVATAELFQAILHANGLHVACISGRKPKGKRAAEVGEGLRTVTYEVTDSGSVEPAKA